MLDTLFHLMQPTLDAIAAHPVAAAVLYLFIGAIWAGVVLSPSTNQWGIIVSWLAWPIEMIMSAVILIRIVFGGLS